MIIVPPNDKLIIEVDHNNATTKSGLYLATDNQGEHTLIKGKVKYAGVLCKIAKEGDYIYFEKCFSRPCYLNEEGDFKIVKESDMVGKIVGVKDEN